jgi:hypothetical protein
MPIAQLGQYKTCVAVWELRNALLQHTKTLLLPSAAAVVEQREVKRREQEAARTEYEKCVTASAPGWWRSSFSKSLRATRILVDHAARCRHRRFHKHQKALEQAAGNPFKEDLARKEREARERAREAELIGTMLEVRPAASDGYDVCVLLSCSGVGAELCLLCVAACLQAERTRELAAFRADEEEKLTDVLAKQQQEQQRREREIQHLKAQSMELRE